MSINGFNVAYIEGVEGFEIGRDRPVTGIGIEKVAGRAALRVKGINPDLDNVTREVQNTASMEAALREAALRPAHENKQVYLSDTYTLSPPSIEKESWYIATKCPTCKIFTPACCDPVDGDNAIPFSGIGALKFPCVGCNSFVIANATMLFSISGRYLSD